MKNRKLHSVLLAVAIVTTLMMSGCPKPTAEMKKAEDAISDAKAAGAAEYASAQLAAAEQALAEGRELMDKYRYNEAKEKFQEAYRLALAAKNAALAAQAQPCPEPDSDSGYTPAPPAGSMTSHTVVKGECLWWIAEYDEVYGDPFQWPLIYWENQDEIDSTAHSYGHYNKEEDWIYPGQQFDVPRDSSMEDIKKARSRAGAPAPYAPGE